MKRIALRILIGSVVVSALLGIWALLSSEFGELQVKVLLTSLCISGASILAMACAAAWDRGPAQLLPRAGMALAIGGFGLLILLIWTETESKTAWKTVGTALVLATAAAHASLLRLATLRRRHTWLLPAAWLTGGILSALIIGAIWGEWDEENLWRWVGVLSILLCAFTILVPVFQRIGRGEEAAEDDERVRVRFCPACGGPLDDPPGEVACGACGGRFHVTPRRRLPG